MSFGNREEAVVLLFAAAAALAHSTILIVKALHCAVAIGSKNVHLVIIDKVKSAEEPGWCVLKLIQTLWTSCCTNLHSCWVKWRIVYTLARAEDVFHNFSTSGPKLCALGVLDGLVDILTVLGRGSAKNNNRQQVCLAHFRRGSGWKTSAPCGYDLGWGIEGCWSWDSVGLGHHFPSLQLASQFVPHVISWTSSLPPLSRCSIMPQGESNASW